MSEADIELWEDEEFEQITIGRPEAPPEALISFWNSDKAIHLVSTDKYDFENGNAIIYHLLDALVQNRDSPELSYILNQAGIDLVVTQGLKNG